MGCWGVAFGAAAASFGVAVFLGVAAFLGVAVFLLCSVFFLFLFFHAYVWVMVLVERFPPSAAFLYVKAASQVG